MLATATLDPEKLGALPLESQVAHLWQTNQAQAQEILSLRRELQLQRQKLDALIRRYFGSSKNEAIDPAQLELLMAGLAVVTPPPEAPASPVPPPVSKTPRTSRPPARSGLPVEKVVLIPEEVQANPEAFRQIEEVVTKELDWEAARFFIREYVRPKFVRQAAPAAAAAEPAAPQPGPVPPLMAAWVAAEFPALKEVLIAALPNRLIEKGLPGVGLLVHLILSRFEDHLPFYRLEKIFRERHGVPVARQTMVDWTEKLATWLQPIYRQMVLELLAQKYLQADETPIWYLDREVPGRACQGYFWAYGRPGGDVIFDWQTSRGREGPAAFLKNFQGHLQADGYGVYSALAQERKEDWKLFCCWAHARRKFFEAREHDRRALWILKQIGLLYAVEERLRRTQSGPALRQAARAAQSKMIVERLGRRLRQLQPQVLAQSLLGKAIGYTLKLWSQLNGYLEHGEVEIDNNLLENAIRPTAIGKKNFLFIGHPEAGWRSAVLYSILGSCRRHRIDPAKYLSDVLKRLPDMKQSAIPDVTPKAWAKAHPEARTLPPK